jgi:hypothetical protein
LLHKVTGDVAARAEKRLKGGKVGRLKAGRLKG